MIFVTSESVGPGPELTKKLRKFALSRAEDVPLSCGSLRSLGLLGQLARAMNPQLFAINQLILDATDAAARLDAVNTHGDRDAIFRALQTGQKEYGALLKRSHALVMLPGDTALINVLLANLETRMNYLHSRLRF